VGPSSNVYVAGVVATDPDDPSTAEIAVRANTLPPDDEWVYLCALTANAYRDSDPHVVASTDGAAPAVWTAFTATPRGDADLLVQGCPSQELSHCRDVVIGESSTASEYWGDMKAYVVDANRWVNMVWIEDDGTYRDVHWAWSSGDSPWEWHGDVIINDHDAYSWPS